VSDLHFSSLADVAQDIKARRISPVELTDDMLGRIEVLNPTYHAFSQVLSDRARAQAAAAEREISTGVYRGPLHGVPIAVKDLFDVAGEVTGCGSIVRQNVRADGDARVVEKLQDAGAVIVGKLNMTEFALSGYHPDLPAPVNP